MIGTSRPDRTGHQRGRCSGGRGRGPAPMVGLVRLVLALATGLPLRSAEHFLPRPGEQATPYLGV